MFKLACNVFDLYSIQFHKYLFRASLIIVNKFIHNLFMCF